MKNAKQEFLDIIKNYKLIAAEITFGDTYSGENKYLLKPLYNQKDYDNFLLSIDKEYNNGYGGQELFGVIFCEDGVWMQRGEYDGSEWWDIYQYPDMRNSFSEPDVLRYERNRKLKIIKKISNI